MRLGHQTSRKTRPRSANYSNEPKPPSTPPKPPQADTCHLATCVAYLRAFLMSALRLTRATITLYRSKSVRFLRAAADA